MKKIFRLSAIVAMLSMMATATVATSCSDDDDDSDAVNVQDITWNQTSITVKKGSYVYYKHGSEQNAFEVTSAENGKITIEFATGETVVLSDDGTSYCSTDREGITMATAKENPASVLFALKASSLDVVSGTLVSNSTIASGATVTYFSAAE